MAGVAIRKARTGPNPAPFLCRLIATGIEPKQHRGMNVPAKVQ